MLKELFLPRTDAGAGVQLIVAVIVYGLLLWRVRSNEARWFVAGLAMLTMAWFALRTVH